MKIVNKTYNYHSQTLLKMISNKVYLIQPIRFSKLSYLYLLFESSKFCKFIYLFIFILLLLFFPRKHNAFCTFLYP